MTGFQTAYGDYLSDAELEDLAEIGVRMQTVPPVERVHQSVPNGTIEACEVAGITYRQIDYWLRRGVFGERHSVGSGRQREFTDLEMEAIKVVGRFSRFGVSDQSGPTTTAWTSVVRASVLSRRQLRIGGREARTPCSMRAARSSLLPTVIESRRLTSEQHQQDGSRSVARKVADT